MTRCLHHSRKANKIKQRKGIDLLGIDGDEEVYFRHLQTLQKEAVYLQKRNDIIRKLAKRSILNTARGIADAILQSRMHIICQPPSGLLRQPRDSLRPTSQLGNTNAAVQITLSLCSFFLFAHQVI